MNVCRLRVTFNYFNVVGEDGNCKGDYLDVVNSRICGVLERYTQSLSKTHFFVSIQIKFYFYTEEIPFVSEKIMLNFHTNHFKTANGFHLVVDQVDCIALDPIPNKPKQPTPTKSNGGSKTVPVGYENLTYRPPTAVLHQKNTLKYDDDDIISDMDTEKTTRIPSQESSVSTTRPYIAPKLVDIVPHVEYVEDLDGLKTTTPEYQLTKTTLPTVTVDKIGPNDPVQNEFPLRYFSHNITVTNPTKENGDQNYPADGSRFQQRIEQSYHTQMPEPTNKIMEKSGICDESVVKSMFFELKGTDLKMVQNGGAFTCQLHVKKSKPNICQMDIMFIHYNLNDTTCGQQYLSVDGERICGHVQESTIKKFWFVRPELYLFVKLNNIHEDIGNEMFYIKARQVECATNFDPQIQQQRQSINTIPDSAPQMKQNDQTNYEDNQQANRNEPEYFLRGPKGQKYNTNRNGIKQPNRDIQRMDEQLQRPSFISEDGLISSNQNDFQGIEPEVKGIKTRPTDNFNRYCDLIDSEMQFKIISPKDRGIRRCRYTIRKANEKVCAIDIKFKEFHLQDDPKCEKEYMEIDSGKICGSFPIGHERLYYLV